MKSNLFRENSLENISSSERLNEYIKITNPGVWSVIVGCLIFVIGVVIWTFYGSIPNTVKTTGIIFPQKGVVEVVPVASGRISDMRVKVGDHVEVGQIIAVIPQENIISEIEELRNINTDDELRYNRLLNEYERNSLIISPVSGIVLYSKSTNETVSSSDTIARIVRQEKYADNKQIISYIPSSVAKKLKEGMKVQVSPDFAPREEYGYMYGYITSVGKYPVSQNDVIRSLGNLHYAQELMTESNSVEVRVTLTVDPNSPNKIKWSNAKGESIPLTIGTYTNMIIIVENHNLYELVFN